MKRIFDPGFTRALTTAALALAVPLQALMPNDTAASFMSELD